MEQTTRATRRWRFTKARVRIPERDFGITGDSEPPAYNEMLRFVRDHGWMPTDRIVRSIPAGFALEVGPGPGYLGLEWLKSTKTTRLLGYDISAEMLAISKKNAQEYGLSGRVEYKLGDVREMPFEDGQFDAVFSNDSFHEWAHPVAALNEIYRVLKPGGVYHISDLRRDMGAPLKLLIWTMCRQKTMRAGWLTSIDASYTLSDLEAMLRQTIMAGWQIEQNRMRFFIKGRKQYGA